MKKVNVRSLIWMALITCSLTAYVYLNTTTVNNTANNVITEEAIEEEDADESKILLPDVALIKKIIGITKVAFHKTS